MYPHYAREFLRLTSNLYYYLYQCNVPNISTLITTILVSFVSSELRWLWLVTRNRYLQCDGVKEIGVLDEDDRLKRVLEECEMEIRLIKKKL